MSTTTTKNRTVPVLLFIIGCIILTALLLFMLKNRAQIKAENRQLQEQLVSLSEELAAIRARPVSIPQASTTPAPTEEANAPFESAVISTPEPETASSPPPAPPPGLTLEQTAVSPSENGLQATLTFKPNNDRPLGDLFVAVRLPGGEGRIQSIKFSPQDVLFQYMSRVSDSGDFAAARGQAGTMETVELTIEVSEPAELDVRGTCGIGPMSLVVSQTDAVVGTPK